MRPIKTYLIAFPCCMAFMFNSCHQGDTPPTTVDMDYSNEVSFDISYLDTRGSAILSPDEILSMGIFGYSTGTENFSSTNSGHTPNLLYNQMAGRPAGGQWSYDPIVYWPLDLSVKNSFFAYSPHSSVFPEEANVRLSTQDMYGYPTLRYTLPSVIADQHDILYASPVLNQNRNSNDGKVLYQMKHALCWLAFVVAPSQYNNPDETYTVTWLSFMGDQMPSTSTLNLGTGDWSTPTYEQVMYEFELTAAAENIKPGEAARIIDPTNRLMLFPIEIDGETSGATVDLTFTYDADGEGGNPGDPEEYYYYTPFPTTRMIAGYVIVYLINISVDGVSLSFMEQNRIEDWIEDNDGKDIEIF